MEKNVEHTLATISAALAGLVGTVTSSALLTTNTKIMLYRGRCGSPAFRSL